MKEPPAQRPPAALKHRREEQTLEQRWVREVLAGNADEFRHLVAAHKDRVFSMALRMVGDRSVAEELTQETFVKAYSKLSSFRFESSFATWITRIALNHVGSYFESRRYRQERKTISFDPEQHDRAAEEQHAPNLLNNFRTALETLKPAYRDVLVLCILEDKPYDEAALILGIPVGTVRSRLNRAREQVKQILDLRLGAA